MGVEVRDSFSSMPGSEEDLRPVEAGIKAEVFVAEPSKALLKCMPIKMIFLDPKVSSKKTKF